MENTLDTLHNLLDKSLFHLSGRSVTGATLLTMVVVVVASLMLSRALRGAISEVLRRRNLPQEGRWQIISRLLHYTVLTLGIAIALDTFGINLGALFTAGAVFAVGFGFAMQTIAQNFVSGLILVIEGAIKPGDVLMVDGQVVRVIDMGIRSTLARSRFDEELIIPNSSIVQATVKNFTLHDSLFRVVVPVGVSYSSDMDSVRKALNDAALAVPDRVVDQEPVVQMLGFGDSSVQWEVSVWIDDPWNARFASSALHEAIWRCFKRAGITIAFPQLDVHFDAAANLHLSEERGIAERFEPRTADTLVRQASDRQEASPKRKEPRHHDR